MSLASAICASFLSANILKISIQWTKFPLLSVEQMKFFWQKNLTFVARKEIKQDRKIETDRY